MAIVFGDDLQPHGECAAESEVLELGTVCLTMGHEDVDVDLVDQFDGILAVGVVSVVDCLEQGIAFPVEILFGHEGVSAQYGLGDLLIGIAIEVHV